MSAPAFLRDRRWWRDLMLDGFGRGFWVFLGVAIVTGAACWALRGREVFLHALFHDLDLLGGLLPRVLVALSIAALIWFLLPRDRISTLVGSNSGLRGLVIATAAGIVTPGGPSSAYALLAVLGLSGADRGPLIAYITSWGLLGLQRVLVWDVPFMGAEFAILRFLVCLPLPIVAGLIARRLPLAMRIRDQASGREVEA